MTRFRKGTLQLQDSIEDAAFNVARTARLTDDLPKVLISNGVNPERFFENITLPPHLDIRPWSTEGISFRGAILVFRV